MNHITPYKDNNSTKKEQVREMFDNIAPRYDLLNHLLSLGIDRSWRSKLVAMAAQSKPKSILDVATGTGDLAIALARRCPQARVTAIDLSPEMLEVGRRKVAKRGLSIEMLVSDAEQIPLPDNSFDTVTAAFGVRNFENPLVGLKQMCRVLKRGGEIYVLEFSTPRHGLFAALYKFYFHNLLPLVGRAISKEKRAYSYLPESVEAFACGEQFLQLLADAGFSQGSYRELMGGIATIYRGIK